MAKPLEELLFQVISRRYPVQCFPATTLGQTELHQFEMPLKDVVPAKRSLLNNAFVVVHLVQRGQFSLPPTMVHL